MFSFSVNEKSAYIWETAALAAVCALACLTFFYSDLRNTVDNTNILLKCLCQGHFRDFYESSVALSRTNFAANYNFLIYVIMAVWQAPMLLLTRGMSLDYLSCPWALLWSKLFLVVMSLAAAVLIRRIVTFCGVSASKAALAQVLFFSSFFTFYPIMVCAQLDIISATLMLAGFYAYLKNNTRLFWLFFALAAPCKMFALFLALPLILSRWKNLLKAVLFWASLAVVIVGEKLLFADSAIYTTALGSQSRDALAALLQGSALGGRLIPFIAVYLVILLLSWMRREPDGREAVSLCFLVWGSFIALSGIRTYWVMLVIPFMVMAMVVNSRFLSAGILAETAAGAAYFLHAASVSHVLAYDGFVSHLFLPSFMAVPDASVRRFSGLPELFDYLGLAAFDGLYTTVFITGILVLMVLTLPVPRWQSSAGKMAAWTGQSENAGMIHGMIVLRILLLNAILVVSVYAFTAKTGPVLLDNRGSDGLISDVNLISAEEPGLVCQALTMEEDGVLHELTLKFSGTHMTRANMALIDISLENAADGSCLFEKVLGVSTLTAEEPVRINLKKMPVTAGQALILRIQGHPGNAWYHDVETLSVCLSDNRAMSGLITELPEAVINNEPAGGSLWLQLR